MLFLVQIWNLWRTLFLYLHTKMQPVTTGWLVLLLPALWTLAGKERLIMKPLGLRLLMISLWVTPVAVRSEVLMVEEKSDGARVPVKITNLTWIAAEMTGILTQMTLKVDISEMNAARIADWREIVVGKAKGSGAVKGTTRGSAPLATAGAITIGVAAPIADSTAINLRCCFPVIPTSPLYKS